MCLPCLVLLIQSPWHKVSVNLAGCFEKGQAYVAMSRARSCEGLQIKGLNKKVWLIGRCSAVCLARHVSSTLIGRCSAVLDTWRRGIAPPRCLRVCCPSMEGAEERECV